MDHEANKPDQGEFEQLTGQLADLGCMFDKANRQIVDYLARRDAQRGETGPSSPVDTSELAGLLRQLGEKLDRAGSAAAPVSSPPAGLSCAQLAEHLTPILEKLGILDQQNTALFQTMEQLRSHIDGGVQSLAELLVPQPEQEDSSSVGGDWITAVLGLELAAHDASRHLLEGVLAGDGAAQGLAGQLLVFRSAPSERLPHLLKDVGEAFYRWHSKTVPGNDAFEEALANYVQRSCENAGIYNSIELVHPGERFDAARHNAASRGVEIIQVFGWIVLRDNGKVYTKAAVEVR